MRILNIDTTSIVLSAALSLALSAGAIAQSAPASTDSQSSKPSAAQTAPEQTPPNQQPSTSSGTQASPQQGAAQQSGSASIDDELQLTDDQKQKIAVIVDDENKQISAIRDDNSISMEQKQQKALAIRQAATPKIKAILTPDQLQKLAVIQQRMRTQQESQQPQNSAPSSSPNPQN